MVGVVPGGALSEMLNSASSVPVLAKSPVPTPVKRMRIASRVAEANLIHDVAPQYPPEAGRARIEGTVVLMAVIGKDGTREGCANRKRFANTRASRYRCREAMALQAIHDRRENRWKWTPESQLTSPFPPARNIDDAEQYTLFA